MLFAGGMFWETVHMILFMRCHAFGTLYIRLCLDFSSMNRNVMLYIDCSYICSSVTNSSFVGISLCLLPYAIDLFQLGL